MHPGLSVFPFQISCIRCWNLRLKAQEGWKTRTSPEEMLQFQNLISFCVKMKLQAFQNTFSESDEMWNDRSALLGCDTYRCHCFPEQGTSRAGAWALCQPRWLLAILGCCCILSDMASTSHFRFNTQDEQAAFRFWRSDEVFLSLAVIKTSTPTWTSCRSLEIDTVLQNPLVLPKLSFLHQLLISFHEYLTAWINHLENLPASKFPFSPLA